MILKMNLAAIAGTLLLALTPLALHAQEKKPNRRKRKPAEPTPPPPKEESSSTDHSIKIAGQTIPYKARRANHNAQERKGRAASPHLFHLLLPHR